MFFFKLSQAYESRKRKNGEDKGSPKWVGGAAYRLRTTVLRGKACRGVCRSVVHPGR